MKMTPDEFKTLLDKIEKIAFEAEENRDFVGVMPFDTNGNRLSKIHPNCILFYACGESAMIFIDEDMVPREIQAW